MEKGNNMCICISIKIRICICISEKMKSWQKFVQAALSFHQIAIWQQKLPQPALSHLTLKMQIKKIKYHWQQKIKHLKIKHRDLKS